MKEIQLTKGAVAIIEEIFWQVRKTQHYQKGKLR